MATEQKFTNETLFVETEITDGVANSNNPPTTKAVIDYISDNGFIIPAGTITITENDTYDVTNYASAAVNVSGGESDYTTATLTVTATYEAPAVDIEDVDFTIPFVSIENNTIIAPVSRSVTFAAGSTETSEEFTVLLYNGSAVASLQYFHIYKESQVQAAGAPTTSGDITLDLNARTGTITGDATIIGAVSVDTPE